MAIPLGASGRPCAVAVPVAEHSTAMAMQARTILDIRRQYNPRVWFVLAAAVLSLAADVTDRRTQTVPLPQGKAISIDIAIGTVRVEGWDRPDTAEITVERHAPSPAALSSLEMFQTQ
mgnify:FL=1